MPTPGWQTFTTIRPMMSAIVDAMDNTDGLQREPPGFPHLLHVLHTSNTGDDRAEDDGGDDHFDEADEAVAERFHLGTDVGEEVSQEDAENNGADHLEIKNLVNRGTLFAHDAHYLSGPLTRPVNCSVPLMFQSGVY